MKKVILSLCIVLLLFSNLNANDTKEMTNEEFMAEFMRLEERQNEAKAKTERKRKELEAVKKLGRTVDKLAKTIGVDD